MDGAGFDAPLDFPVVDHLDTANLGKRHAVVMREMKSGLGKGEAIIAIMPTEPRKTRGFACFTTAEKGFESQIKTSGHVLQDLRMHVLEGRTFSFQDRKRIDLRVARQALSTLRVSILTSFKQRTRLYPHVSSPDSYPHFTKPLLYASACQGRCQRCGKNQAWKGRGLLPRFGEAAICG